MKNTRLTTLEIIKKRNKLYKDFLDKPDAIFLYARQYINGLGKQVTSIGTDHAFIYGYSLRTSRMLSQLTTKFFTVGSIKNKYLYYKVYYQSIPIFLLNPIY